jgi:hypothetical protein
MKKILLVSLVGLAFNALGQVGTLFPSLAGETLEARALSIPEDCKGKITLVGMAWSKKSEEILNTWYTPMYDKFVLKRGMFDSRYDVNMFFVPMYTGMKKAAYETTLKQLRESNRKDLFPYILFYKGSMEPYEKPLKLDDEALPYFFVLDEEGKILYATSGSFSEKKMEAVEAVLE